MKLERNYTTVFIALFLVGKYLFQLEPIIFTVVASHKKALKMEESAVTGKVEYSE